jgi:ketosteroid isomerase-like protein
MSEQNVEAVRRTVDAWNEADLDAWLSGTAPDVEWFTALEGLIEGVESGFEIESPLAMLFTFRDGEIVSSKDFLSHEDAIEAAGAA